ncbi:MAG: sulfite exporter TauE/SafE family protein [Solirubrobacterales bacterium]|nr:sulfite exporter TauE/SafE family protein [Solirubrobacterales bacterium]
MIEAMLIGLAAGVVAGLLGIGGGALFVPALTIFLDLDQLDAQATSLLAIVPVAIVGTWRQRAYGNVRLPDAAALGLLAVAGAGAGVVIANAVPERVLEVGFAVLILFVASQLVRRALREDDGDAGGERE